MPYKTRRRIDLVVSVLLLTVIGAVAAIAAVAGDRERIDGYWAGARVDGDRLAQVTEVLDYDFGSKDRHGIYRDVPGLRVDQHISVASPTAPDEFVVVRKGRERRIRIGSEARTIEGRHRYEIRYSVDVGFDDGVISWNAVGSNWRVPVRNVELHLVAKSSLRDLRASKGEYGSWDACRIDEVAPGHAVVRLDALAPHEGVTISARRGERLATMPTLEAQPAGAATDPGTGLLAPFLTAIVASLLVAALVTVLLRRSGREMVWAGGNVDAAFGPDAPRDHQVLRVDYDELAAMAATEFVPPRRLSAWQGGVLLAERTTKDHKVAWLLERAMQGEVQIEGSGSDVSLRQDPDAPCTDESLRAIFGGRDVVDLGSYDRQFASAWSELGARLDRWHGESGLWDAQADLRRRRVFRVAWLVLLVGLVVLVASSILASQQGYPWLVPLAVGAGLAGGAVTGLLRAWELRVRTPEGSGLWIRVESFRRFIAKSDARHVEKAAEMGRLLDYTAWAVALGEVEHWSRAVRDAGVSEVEPQALYLSSIAPTLGRATNAASTAPSSSGSGGGVGSVGGGGGGGGGGSW